MWWRRVPAADPFTVIKGIVQNNATRGPTSSLSRYRWCSKVSTAFRPPFSDKGRFRNRYHQSPNYSRMIKAEAVRKPWELIAKKITTYLSWYWMKTTFRCKRTFCTKLPLVVPGWYLLIEYGTWRVKFEKLPQG